MIRPYLHQSQLCHPLSDVAFGNQLCPVKSKSFQTDKGETSHLPGISGAC